MINGNLLGQACNENVKKYVGSCNACQKFSKAFPPKAPLIPPEIIVERFDKIAVDVAGPLVKSKRGYRFILTAIDLAISFVFAYHI